MKEDHMKNGQLKPDYNIQTATTNQYVVDFALYPNPTDFKTLEPFLKQLPTLDNFDKIVADAGYGSEYNYSMLEDKYSDKEYFIPYTMYEKKQNIEKIQQSLLTGSTMKKMITIQIKTGLDLISNITAGVKKDRLVRFVILRSMKQMNSKQRRNQSNQLRPKVVVKDKYDIILTGNI